MISIYLPQLSFAAAAQGNSQAFVSNILDSEIEAQDSAECHCNAISLYISYKCCIFLHEPLLMCTERVTVLNEEYGNEQS